MNKTYENLLGTYAGTCVNMTVNPPVEAGIVLLLRRLDGNEVIGDLTIHGDLQGGSEFSGVISGNRITFVTYAAKGKLTITWTGVINGDTIEGNYAVIHEGILMVMMGLRNQQGVWKCRKSDG